MADIFISYAREDKESIFPIIEDLEKHHDCWIDWDDIPVSSLWKKEIKKGILKCSHFIFFVSEHSLDSEWCNTELRYALWLHKTIIPVVFDSHIKLPKSLTDRQWIIWSGDFCQSMKLLLSGITFFEKVIFWKRICLMQLIVIVLLGGLLLHGYYS